MPLYVVTRRIPDRSELQIQVSGPNETAAKQRALEALHSVSVGGFETISLDDLEIRERGKDE